MDKKRFYVVTHTCGGYSVQTSPLGGAELLQVNFDPYSEEAAILACAAANAALASVGMFAR